LTVIPSTLEHWNYIAKQTTTNVKSSSFQQPINELLSLKEEEIPSQNLIYFAKSGSSSQLNAW
jgi:hypothetical protein